MTDQDFNYWLMHGQYPVVLVEIDTDIPHYISNRGYVSQPTDTPANRQYLPVINAGFAFSEKLSLTGNPSISVGDLELNNEDHSLDSWLDEVWANKRIRLYYGDASWSRNDFRLMFSGVVYDLTSSSPQTLNIVLRDKLERLNGAVSEQLLGGSTTNKDRNLPVLLGEAHNVEPLLVDPANHEYMVNKGELERVIEIRDNGVPLQSVSVSLTTGKFRLLNTPAGTVTVSAQGAKPYTNTAAGLVRKLVTSYGDPNDRFTSDDLDEDNLTGFDYSNPQPLGMWIPDRGNVLQSCQELAASVGAQVTVSRTGKLRLVKLALPGYGTPVEIHPRDYEFNSLQIAERTQVIAGVKLGYNKNWLVQTSLDTGIPPEHKDLFAQEWLTATVRDSAVAATYKLYAEPEQTNTMLLRGSDATAEAQRRLDLWKVKRQVFSFVGYRQLMALELGQAVKLYAGQWGLSAGKEGVVVGLETDWLSGRVNVEVLI